MTLEQLQKERWKLYVRDIITTFIQQRPLTVMEHESLLEQKDSQH